MIYTIPRPAGLCIPACQVILLKSQATLQTQVQAVFDINSYFHLHVHVHQVSQAVHRCWHVLTDEVEISFITLSQRWAHGTVHTKLETCD